MSECLPDLPRYVRKRGGEWQGADHQNGPWRPIPAPQSGLPWPIPPATQDPPAVQSTPADRLALAVCRANGYPGPCHVSEICDTCRRSAAAVAHEIARQVRERHGGSSTTADWLDGVGCHKETVRERG